MEEIFEIARDRLKAAEAATGATRIVLTGGGSQMPGVRALAQEILGRPTRLGRPLHVQGAAEQAGSAPYATAIGLLRWKLDRPADAARVAVRRASAEEEALRSGLVARALAWVKENL
jgi:cell division protein FtsA